MYKKHEAAAIKKKFWTSFGQYMRPVPSAWNDEVNWVNYHTGVKGIYFRLDAERDYAALSIEIVAKDKLVRYRFFDEIVTQQAFLESFVGEGWHYVRDAANEHGIAYSKIEKQLVAVNVLEESHWPDIISFFKLHLTRLDAWWAEMKWHFET